MQHRSSLPLENVPTIEPLWPLSPATRAFRYIGSVLQAPSSIPNPSRFLSTLQYSKSPSTVPRPFSYPDRKSETPRDNGKRGRQEIASSLPRPNQRQA